MSAFDYLENRIPCLTNDCAVGWYPVPGSKLLQWRPISDICAEMEKFFLDCVGLMGDNYNEVRDSERLRNICFAKCFEQVYSG